METCRVEGCGSPRYLRSLCRPHYRALGRNGSAESLRVRVPDRDGLRLCSGCSVWKPLTEFSVNPACTAGRTRDCKPCRAANARAWREANPERARATDLEKMHARRVLVTAATSDRGITRHSLRFLLGDRCSYCDVVLDFSTHRLGAFPANKATIDHIVPLARGGSHTWANVTLCCRLCNQSKGARLVGEWRCDPVREDRAEALDSSAA